MNLQSLARALGGEVAGHQVLCPGPGHSAKDRSVTVRLSSRSPDGMLVHSHAGDDWRAVKNHVLGRLGIGPPRAADRELQPVAGPRAASEPADEDAERRRRALAMWQAGGDAAGSVVERYLAGRGLGLPEAGAEVLRYHAACAFGDQRVPVMLAAMRCIRTDRLQAVHRTALTPAGEKIGRKMLGPAASTAVKLDPDAHVTQGLAIGEGIETCLAARLLDFQPVWALGSVGAIRVFPVLPGIEALTILVESDDGGASEAAARACGARWHQAGRQVILARPRTGGDMNDAIQEARSR